MSSPDVIAEHELPNWMKRARRRFDWGIILVIGFCVLIAWPFITNPSLPRTNDSIHYAFQAADAADALREGRLYPRWSPYALGGLGAPIPHYTPPLASYVTALIEVLFTNNTIIAMRVVHTLAIILAGLMVYVLLMQRVNAIAGLVAALLYVYNPYVSLTVPHVMGDLSQSLALALLPMQLWAVNRLLIRNQATDVMYIALTSAALLLTSPKFAGLGLLLSMVLIFVHISQFREWRPIRNSLGAIFGGFGIASFYWLPALYERDLVQWFPVSESPPPYRLTLSEMFVRTQQLDIGTLRHIPTFNLGWALLLFFVVSCALLVLRKGTRFQGIFLGVGFVSVVVVIWLLPTETWLFGGIVLCLAIGGSVIGQSMVSMNWYLRSAIVVAVIGVLFWSALPIWLIHPSRNAIAEMNPIDQMNYEAQVKTIALLPMDARYPSLLPPDIITNRRASSEETSRNTTRFRSTASAQFTFAEQGTHFARYAVIAEAPIAVVYEQAYFPGWRAVLDDKPLELEQDAQTGLTRINIPATPNSTLLITLGTVPIRAAAWILSCIMFGVIVVWVWYRWRLLPETIDEGRQFQLRDIYLLAVLLLLGVTCRTFPPVQDALNNLREPANYLLQRREGAKRTDSHLEFIGSTTLGSRYQHGDTITFSTYWNAVRESSDLYQVALQLRDSETGSIVYTSEKHPPGYYPTSLWSQEMYVEDRYSIPVTKAIPPTSYVIEMTMWKCTPSCDEVVNFYSPNRQLLGQDLIIANSIIIE